MSVILVSGGAGFLGSHLVERLLNNGNRVAVLDNLSTGSVKNLPDHPNLKFVQGEVESGWNEPVDRIFHLACPASPPKYQENPLKTLDTNYVGTRAMLDLAERHKARLLFTSTSEIYGDPQISPQPESYWGHVNSFGPRSCYDEGKRIGESLCYTYHLRGVEVRIARIFNTYGPRMALDDGRVVSNFMVQALKGEPMTVFGSGEQTRSLCYVDDLVEGLIRLMEFSADEAHLPTNLGNPYEQTILEIAQSVQKVAGGSSAIEFKPLPKDDPRQRKPDISRAQRLLDWSPTVRVADGLLQTCNEFRSRLGCPAGKVSSSNE